MTQNNKLLHEVKVFIAGPNDGLPAQQIIYRLVTGSIREALREQQCVVETFLWNTPRHKQVTDGHVAIQERINSNNISAASCDVFIAYFKYTPRPGKKPGAEFCRTTLGEIETALNRDHPPRMLILAEDGESSLDVRSVTKEQLDQFVQQVACVEDMKARIKAVLEPFHKKLGKPLRMQRLDPKQAENLEEILRKPIRDILEEVLQARESESASDSRPDVPREATPVPDPYVGLVELTIGDGDVFFGHRQARDGLLERLRTDPRLGLICIHGPSGTGKSSLLKAGLLHSIVRKRALADRPYWAYAQFNPGELNGNPFQALIEACITHTNDRLPARRSQFVDELPRACQAGVPAARDKLRQLLELFPHGASGLIIAVNQMEELWGTASAWRDQFLTLIAAAAGTPGYLTLATLRSDRLADFTTAPQIVSVLQGQAAYAFPLGPPDVDVLTEMIAEPARVAQVQLEDGLARTIARQIAPFGDAALPMLAAFMRKLWLPKRAGSGSRRITHADFETAGSPAGIVQTLVGRISTEHDRAALRSLFSQLVDVRDGRVISISTPVNLFEGGDAKRAALVDQLASDARVLQIGGGPVSLMRIAHESLFELWSDLKSWIKVNLDDHKQRDELMREARLWAERGDNAPPTRVSDARLREIAELRKERPELFSALTASELKVLDRYLDRATIERQRELLIDAVKGGEVTNAVIALRVLRRLLPLDSGVLDLAHRGEEEGGSPEPGRLKCEFWAALTGDDDDRTRPGRSIFDGPDRKQLLESEMAQGTTPLSWAVVAGQLHIVKRLIQRGADLHRLDLRGCTLLHLAACGGDAETVRYLISKGIDPTTPDKKGHRPILWAITHDQREVVAILRPYLDQQRAHRGYNAFTEAARTNDVALLDQLVNQEGHPIDYRTQQGSTALHIAAGSERTNTDNAVRWLIEHGVPVDARDTDNATPLHSAAGRGSVGAIRLLVEAAKGDREVFLNCRDAWQETPLHDACGGGNAHAVRTLLELGADPNARDDNDETPLSLAVSRASLRSTRLILESARLVYTESDARKHVEWALIAGDYPLLRLLLRYAPKGALNADLGGKTSLMKAAALGRREMCLMLLDAGADPRVSMKNGDVLGYASSEQSVEAVSAIKEWARARAAYRDWLAGREQDQAIVRVGASVGATTASETAPVPPPPMSVEEVRARLARGIEQSDATAFLSKAVTDNATDVVDAILELTGSLLRAEDLDAAATLAGSLGLTQIARRLIAAGAQEPWWWQRSSISESQLGFLSFKDLDANRVGMADAPWNRLRIPGGVSRVRSARLPFLAGQQFFAAEYAECPGQNEVFFLETAEGNYRQLDWSNGLIYACAESASTITVQNAVQYMQWFYSLVRDAPGRFRFVGQMADIPWLGAGVSDPQRRAAFALLTPWHITRHRDDHLLLRGSILFRDTLFAASVRLALRSGAKFGKDAVSRGQLELDLEKSRVTGLPVFIDGPQGIFG